MPLRPTVAGKRFSVNTRLRTTSLLRTASIFLVFVTTFFVFYDFRATVSPPQPLIAIDPSHTSTDPEFANLPSAKAPPQSVQEVNAVPQDISFARGLEQGSAASDWGRDDGPRPIPLPPKDSPVTLPEPVTKPLLRKSSWAPPSQPILDKNRWIATDDLRASFGILPTNRTLVHQRLVTRLENYDIREDEHFLELAIHANLTSIYLRYNHLAHGGWGSLFPSDPSDEPRDHLYHVHHTGIAKKGYAVYASVNIPAATILGLYGGELVDASEAHSGQYSWEAPAMTLVDPSTRVRKKYAMVLDSSRVGNLLRFVNDLGNKYHNVGATWVPIDNRWNLFYFATKNITAGDELSISYGPKYWSHKTSTIGSTDESSRNEAYGRIPQERVIITGGNTASMERTEPHGVTLRKVGLRKQYLQRRPPLSVDFVKSPSEHHAQGTRYV